MGEKEKTKFLDVEEPGAGVEPKKDIQYHEDKIVKAEEKDPYRDIQAGPGMGVATNPDQKTVHSDSEKKSTLFSRIFD
jgi:hypothetical protein